MTWSLCVLSRVFALPLVILAHVATASAQTPPSSPPSAQFGDAPAQPAAPPPAEPAPQAPPAAAPPPAQAQPPATPQPQPQYAQQPAPPAPQPYAPNPNAQPGYGQSAYEPPPPPPPPAAPEDDGFKMPGLAVRVDPLDLLLEGKLGLELEVELWKFLTLEVVPTFIINDSPPTFNLSGREDNVTQESKGLGALAGASFAAGFWLEGKAFKGYLLRAMLTNIGTEYLVDGGTTDRATYVERHLYGFFGSYNRWGAFTLGGGMGIGVELNKQSRCFVRTSATTLAATNECPDEEFLLRLDPTVNTDVVDLASPLYPVQFFVRLSLGVVID